MAASAILKIIFRLSSHDEKGTPGLLLPIQNLYFCGAIWTFKGGLLSAALMAEAIFAANRSEKVQKRVGMLIFSRLNLKALNPKRHVYGTENVV